jgi:hypothetical protein
LRLSTSKAAQQFGKDGPNENSRGYVSEEAAQLGADDLHIAAECSPDGGEQDSQLPAGGRDLPNCRSEGCGLHCAMTGARWEVRPDERFPEHPKRGARSR